MIVSPIMTAGREIDATEAARSQRNGMATHIRSTVAQHAFLDGQHIFPPLIALITLINLIRWRKLDDDPINAAPPADANVEVITVSVCDVLFVVFRATKQLQSDEELLWNYGHNYSIMNPQSDFMHWVSGSSSNSSSSSSSSRSSDSIVPESGSPEY